jgi:hypothetical protein
MWSRAMSNSQQLMAFQAAMQSLLAQIDAIRIPQDDPAALTGGEQGRVDFDLRLRQAQVLLSQLEMKSVVLRDQYIQALVQERHEQNLASRAQPPEQFDDHKILEIVSFDLTGDGVQRSVEATIEARFNACKAVSTKLGIPIPGAVR